MTNDVTQIEQGIHSHILHIYEIYRQKGYAEHVAKQEAIKALVREMWKITGKEDPNTAVILKPALSVSLALLSREASQSKDERLKFVQMAYGLVEDIYKREE